VSAAVIGADFFQDRVEFFETAGHRAPERGGDDISDAGFVAAEQKAAVRFQAVAAAGFFPEGHPLLQAWDEFLPALIRPHLHAALQRDLVDHIIGVAHDLERHRAQGRGLRQKVQRLAQIKDNRRHLRDGDVRLFVDQQRRPHERHRHFLHRPFHQFADRRIAGFGPRLSGIGQNRAHELAAEGHGPVIEFIVGHQRIQVPGVHW